MQGISGRCSIKKLSQHNYTCIHTHAHTQLYNCPMHTHACPTHLLYVVKMLFEAITKYLYAVRNRTQIRLGLGSVQYRDSAAQNQYYDSELFVKDLDSQMTRGLELR